MSNQPASPSDAEPIPTTQGGETDRSDGPESNDKVGEVGAKLSVENFSDIVKTSEGKDDAVRMHTPDGKFLSRYQRDRVEANAGTIREGLQDREHILSKTAYEAARAAGLSEETAQRLAEQARKEFIKENTTNAGGGLEPSSPDNAGDPDTEPPRKTPRWDALNGFDEGEETETEEEDPAEKMQRAIELFNSDKLRYLDQNDVMGQQLPRYRSMHLVGNDAAEDVRGIYVRQLDAYRSENGEPLSDEERELLIWLLENFGLYSPAQAGIPAAPVEPTAPRVAPAPQAGINPGQQEPGAAVLSSIAQTDLLFSGAPAAPGYSVNPVATNVFQPTGLQSPEIGHASVLLTEARNKYAELMAKRQRNLIPIRFRRGAKAELDAAEKAYQGAVQDYYRLVIGQEGDEAARVDRFAGSMINEHRALRSAKVDKLMGDGRMRRFVEWWGNASKGKKVAVGVLIGAGVGIPASFLGGGLPAAAALAGVLGGTKSFLNEAGNSLTTRPQPNAEISWDQLQTMLTKSAKEAGTDEKLVQQIRKEGYIANAQRAIQGQDVDAWTKMIQSMTGDFNAGVSQERRKTRRNVAVMTGVAVGSSVLFHVGSDIVREGINTGHWPLSGNTAHAASPPTGDNAPDMTGTYQQPPQTLPPQVPGVGGGGAGVVTPSIPSEALTVTNGEGWLQTFQEAGLTNTQAWAAVHDSSVMQPFYDQGWAYLRPEDGLAGISHTGQLPSDLLQTVVNKYQ